MFHISSVLLLLMSWGASAQDMGFLSPGAASRVSLSLEHGDMQAPSSQPGLRIQEQKAVFSVPLYKGTDSGLAFIGRGQRTEMGERLRFSGAGVDIPEEFGAADFGFAWNKEDLSGNRTVISATYGNAGTRLFSGESQPVVSANIMWERKKLDHSWYYFLSYSNNRTTLNNIPLPGIAYAINGKTYQALFGAPFLFFMWRPDPFSFSAAASPFGLTMDMGYRFWGPLQVFGSAGWLPRSYQNLVKGRDERLIFDRKEAGAGIRVVMGPMGSFSAGWFSHFDRRFLLGKSISDNTESVRITDSAGWQIKGRISF